MSAQHPQILYIGNADGGRQLHTAVVASGWHVHLPACEEEALAQYIFYMPDIVIVDSTPNLPFDDATLRDTLLHLQSVEASPIIVLTDQPEQWTLDGHGFKRYLPTTATAEQIINAIIDLITRETFQVPSYIRRLRGVA